jgi:hypothetical protein
MSKRPIKREREHKYWGGRHPKDYLLAHNPVQPIHVEQPHGWNGFRVMWIPPEWRDRKNNPWRVCKCGWRPDRGKHYSSSLRPPRKISDLPRRVVNYPPPVG